MKRVLILSTSHKTRGGITSVVKAHQMGGQWSEYNCRWIETHIDKGVASKIVYFIKGWFLFFVNVPFCSLVHIHMSEPPSAIRKSLFMPLAKLWGKMVIVHFHAFSVETTIDSRWRSIYHYMFNSADRVIVLSETWRRAVDDVFELGDRVVVIPNPCVVRQSVFRYQRQNHILYAGTLSARKGYADMIRAFAKIADIYPEWSVVFAGNGEIEEGRALAKQLNIERQVSFLGWVDGLDRDRAFKEASIFCLPSYAEGFPMAILDAWAYGLPVIATPVGGVLDVAVDGHNILLFNPGDINRLSERMAELIQDRELRDRVVMESWGLVDSKFNLTAINREVGELYKSLI
ncbi:MAG: glycosyltransferase family 4 protein [Rikenellaceae bacterium]